jgi:hypothetical protein
MQPPRSRISVRSGTKRAEPIGPVLIELRTTSKAGGTNLRGRLDKCSLVAGDVSRVIASDCWIEINLRQDHPREFLLSAPLGEYNAFRIQLSSIEIDGEERLYIGKGAVNATFEVAIDVLPDQHPHIQINADLNELVREADLSRALSVRVAPRWAERSFKMPRTRSARFGLAIPGWDPTLAVNASITLPENALPPGSKVTVREIDPRELPALFEGQQILGPVIDFEADHRLASEAEITVPYDATRLATAGFVPFSIVVIKWDQRTSRYWEFRPTRIDTGAHLLTIRTTTFSAFFACTPGIEILVPPLSQDVWGETVGFSSESTAAVAGRTSDPGAIVAMTQPQTSPAWAGLGWFDFENVALGNEETQVAISATVDGLAPHICQFVLRRTPPPKRVTSPSRLYGPHLTFSSENRPVVSAVVIQNRFTNDDIFDPIADWQRGFQRNVPVLHCPNDERDDWRFQPLLPDAFFENEAARLTIELAGLFITIHTDPGVPERVRALHAVADFVSTASTRDRQFVLAGLNFVSAPLGPFSPGSLSVSSRVPFLMLEGAQFCAAFVAATLEGADAAARSSLKATLGSFHGGLPADPNTKPDVLAGRLFYVTGSLDDDSKNFQHEIVGDGVWCAAVVLHTDIKSKQPVIVALGVLPDEDSRARSAIRLFRRQSDGTWTNEVVLDDRAFIDVDFDFGPGGDVRIVAALTATPVWVLTQLVLIEQSEGHWSASPIAFPRGESGRISDRGISPRIHVDDQGRTFVVSGDIVGAYEWTIAVEHNGIWNAALIQRGSSQDLTGSDIVTNPTFVVVAGLSLSHWAPAIAPDGKGGLWCAYGNGMLNLTHVDLNTFQVDPGEIDVDRETGFYPSIALRTSGAPAIAYKDPWGSGISGLLDLDDLQFLSVQDGDLVPGGRFAAVLPPFGNGFVDLAAFGPHVRLDCTNVLNPAMLPALLASLVMNLRWHITLLPSDGWYPSGLSYRASHPRLAALIERLSRRPSIAVFSIDNRDFPDENIARIDVTSFIDALCSIDPAVQGDLDSRTVSPAVVRAFAAQRIFLNQRATTINVLNKGSAWDLTDSSGFSQLYQVRTKDGRLEVRVPSVISVIDRAATQDSDHRPMPCGILQETWDMQAAPFLNLFTGFSIDLPKDTPGRIVYASYSDMHVSAYQPADPVAAQQGGIRFTIEIPRVYARNEDPGVDIYATEPSTIQIVLAPFVQEGRISWWVREAVVKIGHLQADVDILLFGWLQWLWLIPGLNLLLLGFNPIADAYATSAVNDQLKAPDTGTLQGLIAQAMQMWVDIRLGETPNAPGPFDAAYLRKLLIRTWVRNQVPAGAQSILALLPTSISFDQATIAGAPVNRNLLLTSEGSLPAFLEDVRVTAGAPEFGITSAPAWPLILTGGESLIVSIQFAPDVPPGFRNGTVTIVFNGGQHTDVPLLALALPRPAASIRIRPPDLLNFGVVVAGQQGQASVFVFNDGDATLQLAVPQIQGDPALVGAFTVVAAMPMSIPPQGSNTIALVFQPLRGGPAHFNAQLVLDSNDPNHPQIALPLLGIAAEGTLLVLPPNLNFGPTPIDADTPPLPHGLPPTVHRGSALAVTIYNTGAAGLTVLAASFQVTDPNGPSMDYHLWNVDGSTAVQVDVPLPAGAMHTLVVQFLPIAVGPHPANIRIRSDDPAQPVFTVNVNGNGIQ